nr:ribonuclease H-like domain-containing protein [Tanacetum cinerariifolium]
MSDHEDETINEENAPPKVVPQIITVTNISTKFLYLKKGRDNSLRLEKAKDRGIVDSGCSRSMSGNKDKLEYFEHFHGGEVTFGGST